MLFLLRERLIRRRSGGGSAYYRTLQATFKNKNIYMIYSIDERWQRAEGRGIF